MSQLAEVPSQVRIKKPLKDKFRTTHDIHRPAVKMGKCQKLTYLQMASSNPVPCRGIIQTVVFVGIYWTGYGGCTQPAWPPFGVTNKKYNIQQIHLQKFYKYEYSIPQYSPTLHRLKFLKNCFSLFIHSDMIFVQNFTQPDFQAKSFTPQKCVICDNFSQINSLNASNTENLGIFFYYKWAN